VSITSIGTPSNGIASIGPDNTVTYTPSVTDLVTIVLDEFEVNIQDDSGAADTSTARIRILPRAQPPQFEWVTPTENQFGCDDACSALGTGWRFVNGGSQSFAMCAGLIDFPQARGLGQQWLVGQTTSFQTICTIQCATTPCWNLPPGASREFDFVFAGASNSFTAADGSTQLQDFPIKCACARCTGPSCDPLYWTPSANSTSCAQPTIVPQPGESFPSTAFSKICRSNQRDGTFGYTGWVDTAATPSCRGFTMDATDYSVWCPGGAA
jgi:hypothetical protein